MDKLKLDTDKLAEICKKNDISYLGVFGSFARKEAGKDSDIDLLARFATKRSLLDLIRLENQFSEVLEKKVDLLTESSISPYLRDKIVSEARTIYE